MGKVEFKLNREGVGELLRSQAMRSILREYGNDAVSRLGDGYETSDSDTSASVRAKVKVEATTYRTRQDNLKNNTILKAVHG